jgi:argininosuccinate lyase
MTELSHTMWGGRFSENQDSFMLEFGASIETDIRLLEVDIEGSLAWAEALQRLNILSADELAVIQNGLALVRDELLKQRDKSGKPFDISLEDVHMTVESRLTELIGEPGAKLHTGRSRNDQVALDERLYLLHVIPGVIELIRIVQRAIVTRAREHTETIIAAYTHLQQAQPVRLGHYLMAWFWMLERDIDRFRDALKRTDAMPLGSGAVAGSGFAVDRMFLAQKLGFSSITANSIDATSDRDHIIETISASAMIMMHLSRIAEDLIIWSSSEFGFVSLPEAFSTGSSMMPQKKNPDSLELVRGKTGRVYGDLITILTVMKGLPFSYGKDMQEDKEPLFDSLDTVEGSLRILAGVVTGMTFRVERMTSNIDPAVLATDVADDIVKNRRIPFRQAHRIAGEQVKKMQSEGNAANDITAFEKSTDRRNIAGGTGKDALIIQIEQALSILDKERV